LRRPEHLADSPVGKNFSVRFVVRDSLGTVTGGRQFQANARKILARSLGRQKLLFGYVFSLRGVEAAKTWSRPLMHPRTHEERRRSPRHRLYRVAKIKIGAGIPPRDCIVIDISDGGVRLFLDSFDAPNEFLLLLSCDGVVRESRYKVVWRHGHEVGAEFLDVVRSGFALQN
jgi:PilZ domain